MINVQVRGECGDVVVRSSCSLDWIDAQRIDQDDFPYLGSLLPYADTMFNARQALRIRRELEDERIGGILGEAVVVEIKRLCQRIESGPHLYLWFLGD